MPTFSSDDYGLVFLVQFSEDESAAYKSGKHAGAALHRMVVNCINETLALPGPDGRVAVVRFADGTEAMRATVPWSRWESHVTHCKAWA